MAIGLAAPACAPTEDAVIGDGIMRWNRGPSVLDLVADFADSSAHLRVERWTVRDTTVDRESRQATRFAATPGLIAVVGHSGSRGSLLGAAVYNSVGIPQVVPNSTSRRLRSAGPWTFTLVPDDSVEGEFLAQQALRLVPQARIAMLYVSDEYGVGLHDGVAAGLARQDRQLVDATIIPAFQCGPRRRDLFRAVATAMMRRAHPDVVIIASASATAACVVPHVVAENPAVHILAGDGVDIASASMVRLSPLERSRVARVAFWRADAPDASPEHRNFVARARRHLGRNPRAEEALTYDAMSIVAAAVREVGNDRRAVRDWIASLGTSRPAWQGVTGEVRFDRPRRDMFRIEQMDTVGVTLADPRAAR